MIVNVIAGIVSYLCGVTPSGFLIAKIYGVNIAEKGSGNVGATNLARTVGKKAGILTLLIDIFKGFAPLFIFRQYGFSYSLLCLFGFLIVCGHCISIPTFLRGGKGVATTAGVCLFLHPLTLCLGLAVFILSFMITKIVSLSSLLSGLSLVIFSLICSRQPELTISLLCIVALVFYRHKENINRILKGQEAKFKSK